MTIIEQVNAIVDALPSSAHVTKVTAKVAPNQMRFLTQIEYTQPGALFPMGSTQKKLVVCLTPYNSNK